MTDLARRGGTDLGDQVLLVTDSAAERQLLGVAAAISGSARSARLLPIDCTAEDARALDFPRASSVLISDDATPAARDAAARLGAALGA